MVMKICRSPLGLRGLKLLLIAALQPALCRSPLGLRGLKSVSQLVCFLSCLSQPTRAAWIEIITLKRFNPAFASQPTRAAWIEITYGPKIHRLQVRSQPTRAAWIEINTSAYTKYFQYRRSPLGLRGLKYRCASASPLRPRSQPTRAAWIEMSMVRTGELSRPVAAHSGCVD